MPQRPSQEAVEELTAQRREVQKIAALFKKPVLGLKDYHAIGEQMRRLSEDPTVARRGSNWRQRVAELASCSPSTLTKALQFRLAYEGDDLADLEPLDVGWSRLTIALAIEDRVQRHALLGEAKEKGWGERELQRAIQQQKGSRRGGGRPRRELISQGVVPDLCELVRLTEVWNEFLGWVWSGRHGGYAFEVERMDEPSREGLRRSLTKAMDELKAMRKQSKEALEVVKSLLKQAGASQAG